ncbi:MAG TPA: glycosyltransferase family 39 protein [Anaerolineales bacterium]|nr:glycosyltransferase family 39 protein [Anaerolineales bacterium]
MMRRPFYRFLAAALFLAAAAVRLTDLTDEPLDFNPTRQLFNAITARGIYYASFPEADPALRGLAVQHGNSLERLEPPILPALAAIGYRLAGGERLWIPRLVSIAAWLAGGWLIVLVGRKMGAGGPGILVGLAYFLFLPLGIYASRSFQIDPMMTVLIAGSLYAALAWSERRTWRWALVAGLVAGAAVFVKGVGALLLGPALAACVWVAAGGEEGAGFKERLRNLVRDPQVWTLFALAVGPMLLYYLVVPRETGWLITNSALNRPDEVLGPSFYIRWLILLDRLLWAPVILAAFGSLWLAPKPARWTLLGLWAGYGLYGLAFPRLITTHDYYQLPLILAVALSLIPAADMVGQKLVEQGPAARAVFAGLLLLGAFYPGWISRSVLLAENYRDAGAYWEQVGSEIPLDGRAIGYTQDYGFRLMYYGWRRIDVLPEGLSAAEFERTRAGADYFVVTARNQMSDNLAEHLGATYPVVAEGGGYVVYDLQP